MSFSELQQWLTRVVNECPSVRWKLEVISIARVALFSAELELALD